MNDWLEKEEISTRRKAGQNNVLGIEERRKIEKLIKAGLTQAFIGELIGVHVTSIGKELRRCNEGEYNAEKAQFDAEQKKKIKNRNLNGNEELEKRINSIEMQIEILFDKMKEIDEK